MQSAVHTQYYDYEIYNLFVCDVIGYVVDRMASRAESTARI